MSECHVHFGNEVIGFCENHIALCCKRCVEMIHKKCRLKTIDEVATGTRESASLKRASFTFKVLVRNLSEVKKKTSVELKGIETIRLGALVELNKFKDGILERIDEVERKTRAEIDSMYNTIAERFNVQMQNINDAIIDVKNFLGKLETDSDASDKHLFIALHRSVYVHERASKCAAYAKENGIVKATLKSDFELNEEIEDFLSGVESFRKPTDSPLVSLNTTDEIKASLQGLYLLRHENDVGQYGQFDSCFTSDGTLIVVDKLNSALKLFNRSYKLIQALKVPCSPTSLTKVSEDELIFYAKKGVYSVSLNNKMMLFNQKLSTINSEFHALKFCRGKFYAIEECEDPNDLFNIGVYDLHWNKDKAFGSEWLDEPVGLTLNKPGDRLYVLDSQKGVVTFNSDGHCLGLTSVKVDKPSGICHIGNNIILVSGESSNNIVHVKDGKTVLGEIVRDDGLMQPQNLCYDDKRQRLIIFSTQLDYFRVYELRN